MNNIQREFKSLRTKQNLTQAALSAASGVHSNTIINFENSKRSPSVENLSLLLDAMGYELAIRKK